MTLRFASQAVAAVLLITASAFGQAPQGLVLARGWDTPMQGGSATMTELATLLSPFAKPNINLAPAPNLKIYGDVTYLMALSDARKTLGLTQSVVPKNRVGCAGFPKDSLYHYAFDGNFDGQYNKLYLVTDSADQVVAVQLVAESPKRELVKPIYNPTEWRTYNFINSRAKAMRSVWVDHRLFYVETSAYWREYHPTNGYSVILTDIPALRIDSLLMNPGKRGQFDYTDWKALEAVRLYLPRPLMETILYCINKSNR